MKKNKIVSVIIVTVFIMITGIFYSCRPKGNTQDVLMLNQLDKEEEAEQDGEVNVDETSQKEREKKIIYAHICGQVANPGVYSMEEGERVWALIELAGGFTKDAAGDLVNQASCVLDGEKIYIPNKEEADRFKESDGGLKEQEAAAKESKVNLNSATLEELMTLPGIGSAKAESILQYREEHKGFKTIEEIRKIQGIKDGVFEKLKEHIMISFN